MPFKKIEVDKEMEENERNTVQEALFEFAGQRSFPNIFVGDQHVDSLQELKNMDRKEGGIMSMLKGEGLGSSGQSKTQSSSSSWASGSSGSQEK